VLTLGFCFLISKWKEPSPLTKPDIHQGLGIPLKIYSGLFIGIILAKASFNLLDKPKLRELFNPKIFNKPASVKCSRFLTISKHCLKSKNLNV
jgi:hypothetical protein